MKIQFLGAAQTVTGSKHLVTTPNGTRVLLDCGLFQGHRRESIERNRAIHVYASSLDAVVLSHAHIDHSGALPILVKEGYRGPIFATPATRDLVAAMLMDAAAVQEADARYINHRIAREGADMERVTPLFTDEDVSRVLGQITSLPYHHPHRITADTKLTFHDAGHVLGSAVTALDVDEDGASKRLVFTGDLGRKRIPTLRDPEAVPGAAALIMESTYGDRLHPPFEDMHKALARVIERVDTRGGRILIPSFALERAQEILLVLKSMMSAKRITSMPVYVDSPLAIQITGVFRLHPECFDRETRALVRESGGPFDFSELRYTVSRGVDGDRQVERAMHRHRGEWNVRGQQDSASPPRRRGRREELRSHRGVSGVPYARTPNRRTPSTGAHLRRRARSSRRGRRPRRVQRTR